MNALEATNLSASYGDTQVLWGISLAVKPGQLVALIGANGAGKTTTLRTICGLVRTSAGELRYKGALISGKPVHQVVNLGITLVPEGRQLFPQLPVRDNLLLGGWLSPRRARLARLRTDED